MANFADNPHGFKIWGECLHVGYYVVPTAPTINLSVGDMVQGDNTSVASKHLGLAPSVDDAAVISTTLGADYLLFGAIVACFDHNMDPIQYIPALKVGDGTVAGYVAVADDPNQEFEAQIDGVGTTANFELNYEITSIATTNAPNANTGLSRQEIAVAGEAVTSTIPIRLIKLAYPEDDFTLVGCRVVCQINPLCHRYGAGTIPQVGD